MSDIATINAISILVLAGTNLITLSIVQWMRIKNRHLNTALSMVVQGQISEAGSKDETD